MLRDVDFDVDADEELRPPAGLVVSRVEDSATLESDRASEPGPFAERLARMGELWRQTTFYLFDAESWRA